MLDTKWTTGAAESEMVQERGRGVGAELSGIVQFGTFIFVKPRSLRRPLETPGRRTTLIPVHL